MVQLPDIFLRHPTVLVQVTPFILTTFHARAFLSPGRNYIEDSVADPEPFDTDPDPALHFDTDPDPAFQFYTAGSGSSLFQSGNVPKTVLFTRLYLIFLVQQDPTRSHTLLNFPFQLILLCSLKYLMDPDPIHRGTVPDPGKLFGSLRIRIRNTD